MRPFRVLLAVLVAAVVAQAVPAGEEKTQFPGIGPEKLMLSKADPTTAGTFDGTWMYVNRDLRFVMWVRTKNGAPQVRLQYQSVVSPEAFETDWDGKAEYYVAGSVVRFDFKLGKSTPDRIVGAWSWVLKLDNSGRRETADVVMHRTGYGRTLLMDFRNYEKTITRDGQDKTFNPPVAWGWTKISNRELLWDELPF